MLNHIYKLLGADPYHGPMAERTRESDAADCRPDRMQEMANKRSDFLPNDQHLPALLRKQVD